MWVRMRYVVEKANKDGSSRWYWQRQGFPTKRLPDGDAERLTAAETLNKRADAEKRGDAAPAEPAFGSIAWVVEQYRQSPKFTRKATSTRASSTLGDAATERLSRRGGADSWRLRLGVSVVARPALFSLTASWTGDVACHWRRALGDKIGDGPADRVDILPQAVN